MRDREQTQPWPKETDTGIQTTVTMLQLKLGQQEPREGEIRQNTNLIDEDIDIYPKE